MSNLGYIQMSLKDPLLSVSLFCHLASIILCALILSETLALYKSFTYLLTYLLNLEQNVIDAAINEWRKCLRAEPMFVGQHFKHFCRQLKINN